MRLLIFLFTMAVMPLPAQSGKSDCADAGTNVEITTCFFDLAQKADLELKVVYEKALKSAEGYSSGDVFKLKAAHQKWEAYRDAQCDAEYSLYGGGSGGPAARAACLLRTTRQHIGELRAAWRLDDKFR